MSDEHERDEAAEETIEDLEAPAETIAGVAGGGCQKNTAIMCVSTIRDADVIAVLEQGRIVEHGSHDELLDRQGLYYHLQASQVA